MFSQFTVGATLLLSLFQTTLAARNVVGTTQVGVGASIFLKPDAASQTGFNAKIYDLPLPLLINFNDDDFVGDGYQTVTPRKQTSGVTTPNFSKTNLISESMYGLYNQDLSNIIIELTGYYLGTYPPILIFH